jgi:hypothetical protein
MMREALGRIGVRFSSQHMMRRNAAAALLR